MCHECSINYRINHRAHTVVMTNVHPRLLSVWSGMPILYRARWASSPHLTSLICWRCSHRCSARPPRPAHTASRLGTSVLTHSICACSLWLPHPVQCTPVPRAPPSRHCTRFDASYAREARRLCQLGAPGTLHFACSGSLTPFLPLRPICATTLVSHIVPTWRKLRRGSAPTIPNG